ncbi:hypothetical protein COK02_28145 [Bacillus cereus]|nr:hypothetical protein COK02_28145 [Bacillus cereus]
MKIIHFLISVYNKLEISWCNPSKFKVYWSQNNLRNKFEESKIEMFHLLMSLVVQYEEKCGGIIWSQKFLLLMMIKRLEILSLFIWKMKV